MGAHKVIHGFLKKPDSITTEELVNELKRRFGKENRGLIINIRRIYNNLDFEDGTYQFIVADVTNIPEHKKDGIKLMLTLFNLEKKFLDLMKLLNNGLRNTLLICLNLYFQLIYKFFN